MERKREEQERAKKGAKEAKKDTERAGQGSGVTKKLKKTNREVQRRK